MSRFMTKVVTTVFIYQSTLRPGFAAGEYPPYDGYLLAYFTGNSASQEKSHLPTAWMGGVSIS